MIGDIRTLFEKEDDHYCKPKRVRNFWNNNYIEYEINGDRNKNLSIEEYLDKIRSYLRDIITDLEESDTGKIQLTMAINFIFSRDIDEERVMHSKSDNKQFMTYDNANNIVDELLETLLWRYQDNLEARMEESEFVLIQFNSCIISFTEQVLDIVVYI